MKFGSGMKHERPVQAGRRSKNIWEGDPEFQKLRASVLGGRMKPSECVWMTIMPEDRKRLGRKNPERSARDKIKEILEEVRLLPDYTVELYRTSDPVPDSWCLTVTYEPPMPATKRKTA